jgi:hypothetical protein
MSELVRHVKRRMAWALLLVLTAFGAASAQETTSGSITGDVEDAQGAPVPGATVTVTSSQGSKTFLTDSNGRFFAPFLTPGRYAVRVELSGFSATEQKTVDVRLGQRVELSHLVLKVGNLEEVVEVVGSAPVVDTHSTTTGGVLESDQLTRIPVGRQFTDSLYLVPGVSTSGVGMANPSVSGGSGLENSYVVDGVNITNSGYGAVGSYSIVFGSLGSGVTTDFIKETQVKTAGFEAEYGQATGGVVNAITQSGTNDLHGSVFGYVADKALESDWRQLQTVNGSVNTVGRTSHDFGVTLGGPLVQNKLFVFGAFNPQYQRRTIIAPPDKPAAALGEVDIKRRSLSYAGKLTWQANANHRVDISAFGDPSHGDLGPQRANVLRDSSPAGSNFSELETYGGHNQVLRYDGIVSSHWLVEASVARAANKIIEIPALNAHRITDATVSPSRTSGGIGLYEQGNDGTNLQLQLKSTNIFQAAGQHQVRYGVGHEDIDYVNSNLRTGPAFTLPNGQVTNSGASITITPDPVFGRIYRVTRANYDEGRVTKQKYLSAFVQDTWQMGSKLTVRPGLRWERQRLVGTDNPGLCHEGDSRPGAGDGSGEVVPCEFTFDNNWSPRLGATYDIKGNGKSKIFASWGRFYAKIPNDLAARALSADSGVARADYFDEALTRPIPDGVLAGGLTQHLVLAGSAASVIDPESKSTYSQELAGGIEVEVFRNVNVGVRYIHRSMASIVEDWQPAPVVAFSLGCPGAESVEYLLANIGPNLPGFSCAGVPAATFEKPQHKYDSVELTANKTFADNWALMASYRWSKLQGNFEGFFRNDNGQSDPAISSLFDFPTNDPSYTQIGGPQFGYRGDIRYLGCTLGCGTLPNDRTHQVKVYGNRSFAALNLGLGFNAGSGSPLTPLAANPQYDSGGEIPEAVRGSGIQTVDGFKERTPREVTVDLHADYSLRFGEKRVVLLADAFNLLNRREPTNYDNWTQRSFTGGENLNFGQPTNGGNSAFPSYQSPRQIRLGARFEW